MSEKEKQDVREEFIERQAKGLEKQKLFKKTDLEKWPDEVLAKMRKPTLEIFKKYWQVALNISDRE